MYFVRAKNNVKIVVYDLNPQGRQAVLMIHGWPLSAQMYEYQNRFLAKRGYRVVTIDLRGFGNSDAPVSGYGYNQLADDVYRVVRAIRLREFILVGFSMGGAIALRYMNLFGGYGVKKLVLLAAAAPRFTKGEDFPYGKTEQEANQLIAQSKTDRPQLCQDFSRELLYSPHSDAVKDWFRDLALSASGIGTVETAYSLRDEDGRADLAAVHVPTGIFHGKQDIVVPFALGELQHRAIRGSELFAFEESGHGIFYDELERFNPLLLEYLEKSRPPV